MANMIPLYTDSPVPIDWVNGSVEERGCAIPRRGPASMDIARQAYLNGHITWWEFEDLVELLLRDRVPCAADTGILHGPAPSPEAQHDADRAVEWVRWMDEDLREAPF